MNSDRVSYSYRKLWPLVQKSLLATFYTCYNPLGIESGTMT